MIGAMRVVLAFFLSLVVIVLPSTLQASPTAAEIGVVVMHGKGGRPGKFVDVLAAAFERAGFQVANLEMPWSGSRHYNVSMRDAVDEVSRALDAMRAKGVKKVFVSGHSQGGLFAMHYAGQQQVDGIVPIAPGGMSDSKKLASEFARHVAKAKQMVAEGRGGEKAEFGDFEGSRGGNAITTTADIYLDWFSPDGAQTSQVLKKVKPGTPVLYVAPTRDYPGLAKYKHEHYGALPSHPKSRLYEPDSDHLNAPAASADEAVRWILEIAQQ